MLGSHSASPDLCRLPSNFNAAADIFMECLTKCLQGDQTRFTSTITTTMRRLGCALGAQQPRRPEPQCAPKNALNSTHLSSRRTGPGGVGDESDTVPAHQEPAVCGRGQRTHKLCGSWVAGDQHTHTGMRGRLIQGGERGVISLPELGSRMQPKMGLCEAIQLLQLCLLLLCLEEPLGLSTPSPRYWPGGLSSPLPFGTCSPHSVLLDTVASLKR